VDEKLEQRVARQFSFVKINITGMIKNINQTNPLKIQLFILVAAALLFIPFLGGVHLFDWDEINFAEAAREMIVTGDFLTVQINFQPFWEKPPLFIWMQVLSMKLFGINEFAARFPNAICGIVTLMVLFSIGRKQKTTCSDCYGCWLMQVRSYPFSISNQEL